MARVTVFVVFLSITNGHSALGATKTWNRTTGGSWTSGGNWTPSGAPNTGDAVIINTGQSGNITNVPTISLLSLTANGTCRLVAASSGNTITVTGTLTVASGVTFSVGTSGGRLNFTLANTATGSVNGTGVLNFDGGTTVRTFRVNGNLTIAPGAIITDLVASAGSAFVLSNGGTLQIGSPAGITTAGASGSVQVTGTRTYNTGANYIYNGTAAQNTGNGLPATVSNLNVNNPNGLTINNNITVAGTLTMSAGNISAGANTITLGTGTSTLGTLSRTSGTIVGNFRRWFAATTASSVLMPIGTSTNYRPAELSFTVAPSTGGTITATFVPSNPGENGLPLDDAGTSVENCGMEGFWTLTGGNGLAGGTYSLDLTADGFFGVNNHTTLRVLKRSSAPNPWTVNGAHVAGTGSTSTPIVHRTGMSGFAEVGIGSPPDSPLPIQLSSFTASALGNGRVRLNWTTLSELNNYGFRVQKSPQQPDNFQTIVNSFVPGHGTTSVPQYYMFLDNAAGAGRWYYRLEQIDLDGTTHFTEPVQVEVLTSVSSQEGPLAFSLEQNYPNPFNPSTRIQYSLARAGHIRLTVFDLLGNEVAVLEDGMRAPGVYTAEWDARGFSAGIYMCRLEGETAKETRRMILLK